MPDSEIRNSNPKDSGAPVHSVPRLFVLLFTIIAIAAVASFTWSLIPDKYKMWQESSPLWDAYTAMRDGDLQAAMAEFQSIQADPSASADEKARAVLLTLGAQNRLTGDTSGILSDVRSLKQAIADAQVSIAVRARLVNALAAQYSVSGNDPVVLEEMFKGEPFSSYFVKGDSNASILHLYEWSYKEFPTALATINLARGHSEPVVKRSGQLTWTMTNENADRTEEYLLEADALVTQEMAADSEFINGSQYFWFRYWRANVVARLADKVGESYKQEYRSGFDEFMSFALAHPAALAKENLPFARFQYAIWLLQIDNDTVAATQQLDKLAQELPLLPYPNSNAFALSIRNASANNRQGSLWYFTKTLSKLSPSFKVEVERIIGAPIQ